MKEFICMKPIMAVFVFSIIFFILGYTTFLFLNESNLSKNVIENKPERQNSTNYKFTNPLLDCNYDGSSLSKKSKNIKEKIEEVISRDTVSSKVDYVSVYFRDLKNGPTIGINEKEKFSPASLLKVPLMISYLKKAEITPSILKDKIIYSGFSIDDNSGNNIPVEIEFEIGEEYEVEELIRRMIIYSDNLATDLLFNDIGVDFVLNVYRDLGVETFIEKTENFMSVKEYASFFRVLYNASYLNREMSEKALKILSDSIYNDGLRLGVPPHIAIAHKFGIRDYENIFQLHDCGIIYDIDSPYILCVMTRGEDFYDLADAIRDISKVVYDEINK